MVRLCHRGPHSGLRIAPVASLHASQRTDPCLLIRATTARLRTKGYRQSGLHHQGHTRFCYCEPQLRGCALKAKAKLDCLCHMGALALRCPLWTLWPAEEPCLHMVDPLPSRVVSCNQAICLGCAEWSTLGSMDGSEVVRTRVRGMTTSTTVVGCFVLGQSNPCRTGMVTISRGWGSRSNPTSATRPEGL